MCVRPFVVFVIYHWLVKCFWMYNIIVLSWWYKLVFCGIDINELEFLINSELSEIAKLLKWTSCLLMLVKTTLSVQPKEKSPAPSSWECIKIIRQTGRNTMHMCREQVARVIDMMIRPWKLLVRNCSIPIVYSMEMRQSCTKPSIWLPAKFLENFCNLQLLLYKHGMLIIYRAHKSGRV